MELLGSMILFEALVWCSVTSLARSWWCITMSKFEISWTSLIRESMVLDPLMIPCSLIRLDILGSPMLVYVAHVHTQTRTHKHTHTYITHTHTHTHITHIRRSHTHTNTHLVLGGAAVVLNAQSPAIHSACNRTLYMQFSCFSLQLHSVFLSTLILWSSCLGNASQLYANKSYLNTAWRPCEVIWLFPGPFLQWPCWGILQLNPYTA